MNKRLLILEKLLTSVSFTLVYAMYGFIGDCSQTHAGHTEFESAARTSQREIKMPGLKQQEVGKL